MYIAEILLKLALNITQSIRFILTIVLSVLLRLLITIWYLQTYLTLRPLFIQGVNSVLSTNKLNDLFLGKHVVVYNCIQNTDSPND